MRAAVGLPSVKSPTPKCWGEQPTSAFSSRTALDEHVGVSMPAHRPDGLRAHRGVRVFQDAGGAPCGTLATRYHAENDADKNQYQSQENASSQHGTIRLAWASERGVVGVSFIFPNSAPRVITLHGCRLSSVKSPTVCCITPSAGATTRASSFAHAAEGSGKLNRHLWPLLTGQMASPLVH